MRNVFNFEKRKKKLIEEKKKWSKCEDDKDCALVLSLSWYTMHLRAKSRFLVVETGKVVENLEKVDVILILIWYLSLQNWLLGNYFKKLYCLFEHIILECLPKVDSLLVNCIEVENTN